MVVMTMILVVLVRELFGTGKHQSQAFNGRTGRTDKRGGAHGSVEEEEQLEKEEEHEKSAQEKRLSKKERRKKKRYRSVSCMKQWQRN